MAKKTARWVAVLLVVAIALAVIGVLLVPLTDLIARHDVSAFSVAQRAPHLQTARETVRTQLLTLGAGVFAAGALVYTVRNFTLSRDGQVADRYTRAIEQLGSDKLDVRIGGIYALERIAHDSPKDHPTVMEVLATFIHEHPREHSPLLEARRKASSGPSTRDAMQLFVFIRDYAHEHSPPADSGVLFSDRRFQWALLKRILSNRPFRRALRRTYGRGPRLSTPPDVQAALTVIGRRNSARDRWALRQLTGADLTGADLQGADLANMLLVGTNLIGALLNNAKLVRTVFTSANLSGASFNDANLTHAFFPNAIMTGADLAGADLTSADLTSADLTGADLTGADLTGADLTGADLTGADLSGADLTDADLTWAKRSANESVPNGWVRDSASGTLERAKKAPGQSP